MGYGDKKQWCWGVRSDRCVAANQVITPGVVYITPWTQDSIMQMSPAYFRFKFSYQIIDPLESIRWVLTFCAGVYKMFKGTGGTAETLKKIPTSFIYSWTGTGSAGPTTVYDGATATSLSSVATAPVMDGALYTAMLWTVVFDFPGLLSVITSYGANVSSGTWLHITSGLAGQTSLPQTIAALGGVAKIFQEHWISVN